MSQFETDHSNDILTFDNCQIFIIRLYNAFPAANHSVKNAGPKSFC
jgi:hypothetical protein